MPEYSISQLGKFGERSLQYEFIYVDGIKRHAAGNRIARAIFKKYEAKGYSHGV